MRGLLLTFVCALLASRAMAAGYSEQELKSLFTTPGERHALNAQRRGGEDVPEGEEIITGPSSLQVTGVVSRSNGKSVVWMNGRNTMDNSMIDGVKVYSNSMNRKSTKIPVMVDGRMVYLKPGETWSEETGVVDATQ